MNTLVYQQDNVVVPVASRGGTWKLTPGLRPFRAEFLITEQHAALLKHTTPGTLIFTCNEATLAIKNLYIQTVDIATPHIGFVPGSELQESASLRALVVQDARFLLEFGSVHRGYNLLGPEKQIAHESVRSTGPTATQTTIRSKRWLWIDVIKDIGRQGGFDIAEPFQGTIADLGILAHHADPLLFRGESIAEALAVCLNRTHHTLYCTPDGIFKLAPASRFIKDADLQLLFKQKDAAKNYLRNARIKFSQWSRRPRIYRYFFPIDVRRIHYTWCNVILHDGLKSNGTAATTLTHHLTGETVKAGDLVDVLRTSGADSFVADYGYASFLALSKDLATGFNGCAPTVGSPPNAALLAVKQKRQQALQDYFLRVFQPLNHLSVASTDGDNRRGVLERLTPMGMDPATGALKAEGHHLTERSFIGEATDTDTTFAALLRNLVGKAFNYYTHVLSDISDGARVLDAERGIISFRAPQRVARVANTQAGVPALTTKFIHFPYSTWNRTGLTTGTVNYLRVEYIHRLRKFWKDERGSSVHSKADYWLFEFQAAKSGISDADAATKDSHANTDTTDLILERTLLDAAPVEIVVEETAGSLWPTTATLTTQETNEDTHRIYQSGAVLGPSPVLSQPSPDAPAGARPTENPAIGYQLKARESTVIMAERRARTEWARDLIRLADLENVLIELPGVVAAATADYENTPGIFREVTISLVLGGARTIFSIGAFRTGGDLLAWAEQMVATVDQIDVLPKAKEVARHAH